MKPNIFLILCLSLLLVSCGALVPTERSSQSAVTTTDKLTARQSENFRRVVEGAKPEAATLPPVKIGGLWNKVELTLGQPTIPEYPPLPAVPARAPAAYREETTYESKSETEASSWYDSVSKWESSIPLGVKLALLGLGLLIVVFAVRYAIKSSAAAQAAATAADQSLASIIRRFRGEAVATTDATDMAWLNAQVAEIEAERGKMAAKLKK